MDEVGHAPADATVSEEAVHGVNNDADRAALDADQALKYKIDRL